MNVTIRFMLAAACALTAVIASATDREGLERTIRGKVATFLEQQKETHGAEAVAELRETKAEIEDDGTAHFWFEQVHEGVPVLLSEARVHTIKGKAPFGRVKVYRGLAGVPTTPSITLEHATSIAAQALGIQWPVTIRERLVIVPRRTIDDAPKDNVLAWSFIIAPKDGTAAVRSHWYLINAVSGEVLLAQDATRQAAASTYHGATPRILPYYGPSYGYYDWTGVRTLCTTQKCKSYGYHFDKFYLEDPCFGLGFAVTPQYFGWGRAYCAAGAPNKDGFVPAHRGGNFVCDRANFLQTCVPFEASVWDPDRINFGDGTPGSTNVRTLVADAYVSLRLTFEWLHRVLQRQGLNGANGPKVRVETRSPLIVDKGAFWDLANNAIVVGPGDVDSYHWATPDVIAHEIGHGLDAYGPKMASVGSCPETPKVQEAMADMFSLLVTRSIEPSGYAWQIVEHPFKSNWSGMTFTPTQAERYLQNPPTRAGYPACYSGAIACMEPHVGSSPAGHMFYLLTYGGTSACNGNTIAAMPSLDVARLWSLAFFKHLSSSGTTYADMKDAFAFAALEMDGGSPGAVSARVQEAFAAINM